MPIKKSSPGKVCLITGFDSFAGYLMNPSFQAAKRLEGKTIKGYLIRVVKLPVEYGLSSALLGDMVRDLKPDIVISLGLNFISKIAIELNAYKCTSHVNKIPWINERSAPEKATSKLQIDKILDRWKQEKIPGELGTNPGAYVCEHIMYSIYTIENLNKSLFLHVPEPRKVSIDTVVQAIAFVLDEVNKMDLSIGESTVILSNKKVFTVLMKKKNKNTDRNEWALVSTKDRNKILKWFGVTKPSEDAVKKEEQRVQYFKHKGQKEIDLLKGLDTYKVPFDKWNPKTVPLSNLDDYYSVPFIIKIGENVAKGELLTYDTNDESIIIRVYILLDENAAAFYGLREEQEIDVLPTDQYLSDIGIVQFLNDRRRKR
ncbi:MAG: hypothetical protein WC942_08800 [Clostridia bacterium]|jgi:pyroglutamyl-peptidase